jgi:hypothetical protein
VALAITDQKFRRALKDDHKKAIDSKRARLKFDHTKLSQRSHDVLASLTEEELDMLHSIHQKAKKVVLSLLKCSEMSMDLTSPF